MPGGEILGADGALGGNWPGGRGTAGWFMRDSVSPSPGLVQSLPPNLTVVSVPPEPRYWTNDANPLWLALPPGNGSGGRTLSNWVRSSNTAVFVFNLSDAVPLLVAQYSTSLNSTAFSFEIASGDGSTIYASTTTTLAGNAGVWIYTRIWGPGQIRLTNTNVNTRVQGFVFDQDATQSPGRLLGFEPGVVGLVG